MSTVRGPSEGSSSSTIRVTNFGNQTLSTRAVCLPSPSALCTYFNGKCISEEEKVAAKVIAKASKVAKNRASFPLILGNV